MDPTPDQTEADRLRRSHEEYLVVQADWERRHPQPLPPDPAKEELYCQVRRDRGIPDTSPGPQTWSHWPRRPPPSPISRKAKTFGVVFWSAVVLWFLYASFTGGAYGGHNTPATYGPSSDEQLRSAQDALRLDQHIRDISAQCQRDPLCR